MQVLYFGVALVSSVFVLRDLRVASSEWRWDEEATVSASTLIQSPDQCDPSHFHKGPFHGLGKAGKQLRRRTRETLVHRDRFFLFLFSCSIFVGVAFWLVLFPIGKVDMCVL